MQSPNELLLQRLYRWEKGTQRPRLSDPAYRRWRGQNLYVRTGHGRSAADGHVPPIAQSSCRFRDRDLVEKLRAHVSSDIAIWLAGHVSVALYPTLAPDVISFILAHSGARAVLLGKLDGWESQATGIPKGIPAFPFPTVPPKAFTRWDDVVKVSIPARRNRAASRRSSPHHLHVWEYRETQRRRAWIPRSVCIVRGSGTNAEAHGR